MRPGCKKVLLASCFLAALVGAGSLRRSDGDWETGRDAVEGRDKADSSAAGEWILEELVRNQRENLALDGGQRLDRTRAVVCKLRGGMGNRIQGMITCLALGLAMRRSTVFEWPLIDENEDSSGLMPCSISELFVQPPGFGEWEYAAAVSGLSPREVESRTVEAYKSMPVRRSGDQPDWRDILLCSNVTSLLEDVPLFAVGSWRYLPTTMSNENHEEHFFKYLPVDQHGDVPFFRALAPVFFRPIPPISAALDELMTYMGNGYRIGLHIRAGLKTDDPFNLMHFFSPLLSPLGGGLARRWASCAYANMPRDMKKGAHTWIVAADSQAAKMIVLQQVAAEEGAISAYLNIDAIIKGQQGQIPEHIKVLGSPKHPLLQAMGLVVIVFQSGSRIIMAGSEPSRKDCRHVQVAQIEMLALGSSSLLVSSHLSTFATLPAANVPLGMHYVVTRDGDCFPTPSTEPMSDATDLFKGAKCFNASSHHRNSWSRPRHPMTRSSRNQGQHHLANSR